MTISPADQLVHRIRGRIWTECDPTAIVGGDAADAARIVEALAWGFIADERHLVDPAMAEQVVADVVAATLGLGPLQALLADPTISEIMVNGPRQVFVERDGCIEAVDAVFDDDVHLLRVIDRILAPIGRRVDPVVPVVDARLADGARVHAVVPPLAVDGPVLTIRRFVSVASTLDDLVGLGACSPQVARRLRSLVEHRANVIVSGGTSTGKTTLLAACLAASAPEDRIVVIEDSAELPLNLPHRVRLESRQATPDGVSHVGVRELVRASLRMRPDRIVVGEVRGEEAFDLLQALNTGHRGTWTTVHANGPADALVRLESMALCAGTGVPHEVMRRQVAGAVDAVVHLERGEDGRRRVQSVSAVSPGDGRDAWVIDTSPATA